MRAMTAANDQIGPLPEWQDGPMDAQFGSHRFSAGAQAPLNLVPPVSCAEEGHEWRRRASTGRDRGKPASRRRCVRQGAIHEGTRKMRLSVRNRTAVRAIALAAALTSAGAVSALPSGMALAANSAESHVLSHRSDRPLVPARC